MRISDWSSDVCSSDLDRFLAGDLAEAERSATEAGLLYAGTEGVHGSIFTHFHQALLQYWQNDLQAALAESTHAEKMVRLFFPADVRLRSLAEAMAAGMRFELAQPEERVDWLDLVARVGADRKSVVEGKSVAERVDPGCRRIIKQKNTGTQ